MQEPRFNERREERIRDQGGNEMSGVPYEVVVTRVASSDHRDQVQDRLDDSWHAFSR